MFYEKGNAFIMFVRPWGYTQCVLVSNTECKHNFCLFTRKAHRAPLSSARLSLSKLVGYSSFRLCL